MSSHLPTVTSSSWTITAFRDSVVKRMKEDKNGVILTCCFYAVTEAGWRAVRKDLMRWRKSKNGREIIAFVGTDHGITEPDAIRLMEADGITVRLMKSYRGVFHPKVLWLSGPGTHSFWIGSNNLTRDGLLNNIECAALLESTSIPAEVERWFEEVRSGSVALTQTLVDTYDEEREKYNAKRAAVGTFTWSERDEGPPKLRPRQGAAKRPRPSGAARGDLVVQVMPRETGTGGKQIQLPMNAATDFFGLPRKVFASRILTLSPSWIKDSRDLTMTIFQNRTVRLQLKELDYRDRPCVLLFRKTAKDRFTFDIVSQSVFPARYRELLATTQAPTRSGSRKWGIIK